MYILDTNICIYALKRNPPAVMERLKHLNADEFGISVVSACELAFGAAKATGRTTKRVMDNFLAGIMVLPLPQGVHAIYGDIRASLERKGQPIGPLDLLIAAHARYLDATIVTNNEREFCRVPKLRVENWT